MEWVTTTEAVKAPVIGRFLVVSSCTNGEKVVRGGRKEGVWWLTGPEEDRGFSPLSGCDLDGDGLRGGRSERGGGKEWVRRGGLTGGGAEHGRAGRWHGALEQWGDSSWTHAVGRCSDREVAVRLRTAAAARSALDRRCQAAFKAQAHGTVATRWSVAQHMTPTRDGALTSGPGMEREKLTVGSRVTDNSRIKTLLNENSSKNSYKLRKISVKFVEEEGVIVNIFCNYNFLRFSMDFELFQIFYV
jgi:hypothetical protein